MSKTLEDIFDDDDFGLLNESNKQSKAKTDDDRLIENFSEINAFYENNGREPSGNSLTEYNLLARLKAFRENEEKKRTLKSYDRFNLLGDIIENPISIDDIFADDEFGLLESTGDKSIYDFKHSPKPQDRSGSDYIAQRKALSNMEFEKYEAMFQDVHKDIREGRRKILDFHNIEKNLHVRSFYILDGIMLYLESAEIDTEVRNLRSGSRVRTDGRTFTVFENSTYSNMLFRSLGKAIQKGGKLITHSDLDFKETLFESKTEVSNEDNHEGWVYVLKSKSKNPQILKYENLHKIGLTTKEVINRIKAADKQATFLNAEVEVIATYKCYNLNLRRLENLIHRFFSEVRLDINVILPLDLVSSPREWFDVPLSVINQAIELLISGEIISYRYDSQMKRIISKV